MSTPIYADNCQACGKECFSSELISVKLGSISFPNIKICLACLVHNDPSSDYEEAAELIVQTSVVKDG